MSMSESINKSNISWGNKFTFIRESKIKISWVQFIQNNLETLNLIYNTMVLLQHLILQVKH